MSCDQSCGRGGLLCGNPDCTHPYRVCPPIDHTIGPRITVALVDDQSGRVVLELPGDLSERIAAEAERAGMTSSEWLEHVLSERGRA